MIDDSDCQSVIANHGDSDCSYINLKKSTSFESEPIGSYLELLNKFIQQINFFFSNRRVSTWLEGLKVKFSSRLEKILTWNSNYEVQILKFRIWTKLCGSSFLSFDLKFSAIISLHKLLIRFSLSETEAAKTFPKGFEIFKLMTWTFELEWIHSESLVNPKKFSAKNFYGKKFKSTDLENLWVFHWKIFCIEKRKKHSKLWGFLEKRSPKITNRRNPPGQFRSESKVLPSLFCLH